MALIVVRQRDRAHTQQIWSLMNAIRTAAGVIILLAAAFGAAAWGKGSLSIWATVGTVVWGLAVVQYVGMAVSNPPRTMPPGPHRHRLLLGPVVVPDLLPECTASEEKGMSKGVESVNAWYPPSWPNRHSGRCDPHGRPRSCPVA